MSLMSTLKFPLFPKTSLFRRCVTNRPREKNTYSQFASVSSLWWKAAQLFVIIRNFGIVLKAKKEREKNRQTIEIERSGGQAVPKTIRNMIQCEQLRLLWAAIIIWQAIKMLKCFAIIASIPFQHSLAIACIHTQPANAVILSSFRHNICVCNRLSFFPNVCEFENTKWRWVIQIYYHPAHQMIHFSFPLRSLYQVFFLFACDKRSRPNCFSRYEWIPFDARSGAEEKNMKPTHYAFQYANDDYYLMTTSRLNYGLQSAKDELPVVSSQFSRYYLKISDWNTQVVE